ncbi:MAG: hypothetical protein ACOCV2_06365 [Persicimonas sp.]
MAELERQPLDASAFDDKLKKHVDPDAPAKLKMMAARGMLPAPPEQTVKILYQLHFDDDDKVVKAVREAIDEMPAEVLGPALQKADHAGLLDWVAERRGEDDDIGAVVVRNQAADDRTVAELAEEAGPELADIIATNQVRVLRTPAIIESLYKNVEVSSATIDGLIELARRNDVNLDGLPGLSAALKSNQDIHDSSAEDDEFNELLKEEAERAEQEEKKRAKLEEEADQLTRSERERLREELDSDGDEGKRQNLRAKIGDMSVAQKIRLSTVGSREAVKILVRDPNKLVHMAAIQSPRIKGGDIKKFASNKSLPDNVIEYIANNRDWTRKYDVVKNLVHNPKTPLKDTLKFLKHLRVNDLRKVSRSRDVPHQVSRAAKSLMRKRTGA